MTWTRVVVAGIAFLVGGCSAFPADQLGTEPPRHTFTPNVDAIYPASVPDPFEGFNRGTYAFNAAFDTYVFLPVLRVYRFLLPDFVEDRVSDFFGNLSEVRNATNGLLQLRPDVASLAIIRFAVNSSFGIGGLFDVAGALGAVQQPEDFGQTMGRWGSGPGPYLVLPILGPSSLRDATGLAVDTAMTTFLPPGSEIVDFVYRSPAVYGLQVIDQRNVNSFRYHATGSPFEYDIVRFLYTKKRELDIAK